MLLYNTLQNFRSITYQPMLIKKKENTQKKHTLLVFNHSLISFATPFMQLPLVNICYYIHLLHFNNINVTCNREYKHLVECDARNALSEEHNFYILCSTLSGGCGDNWSQRQLIPPTFAPNWRHLILGQATFYPTLGTIVAPQSDI